MTFVPSCGAERVKNEERKMLQVFVCVCVYRATLTLSEWVSGLELALVLLWDWACPSWDVRVATLAFNWATSVTEQWASVCESVSFSSRTETYLKRNSFSKRQLLIRDDIYNNNNVHPLPTLLWDTKLYHTLKLLSTNRESYFVFFFLLIIIHNCLESFYELVNLYNVIYEERIFTRK